MSKALKWSILFTLVALALAIIFLQQHVAFLGVIFALVAGWFAKTGWAIYKEYGWIGEPKPRVTNRGSKW